jgi:hypothetical protein
VQPSTLSYVALGAAAVRRVGVGVASPASVRSPAAGSGPARPGFSRG